MAIEGHYKELASGWEVVRRAEGITGTRAFHNADLTATDSLPDVGDLFDPTDDSLENLKAIERRETLYGGKPGQHLFTIQYTTAPGATEAAGDQDEAVDPDYLPVSGALSGEAVSINATAANSTWVWEDEPAKKVATQLFKKLITGNIKVVRRLSALELSTWCQFNGMINSEAITIAGMSFDPGFVMFNGVEYEEYRNDQGTRRWKVAFNFSIKIQNATTSYVGWNYIFDDKTSKFRKPINTDAEEASAEALYESDDLGVLLSTKNVNP
jgi:hypothetical protein